MASIYPPFTGHESKELVGSYPKHALLGVQLHLILLVGCKGVFEVSNVGFLNDALGDAILDIYLHVPAFLGRKYLVY